MRNTVSQCGACQRLTPGRMKIMHRHRAVGAAPVVMRQLIEMVLEPVRVEHFDSLRGTFMQRGALFAQKRTVCHVLSQSVLEDKLRSLHRGLLVYKLQELEVRQHMLQLMTRPQDHSLE